MERHDLHVAPVWEAMSTTALVNAVIHGLGIAVVPRRMVSGVVEQGQVYELKVDGLEFCRCFYIVYQDVYKRQVLRRTEAGGGDILHLDGGGAFHRGKDAADQGLRPGRSCVLEAGL